MKRARRRAQELSFRSVCLLVAMLALPIVAVLAIAACGSSSDAEDDGANGGGGGSKGGDAALVPDASLGGGNGANDGSTSGGQLLIEPRDGVVDATGVTSTLQFKAKFADGSVPNSVRWSVREIAFGTIAPSGLFTAQGFAAGTTQVFANVGTLSATANVTVRVRLSANPIDGNAAHAVSSTDVALLRAGGSNDAAFRWLYPYDRTIFPQGLSAPLLQLGGTAADAFFVTLDVGSFHAEGFSRASGPTRIAIPEAAWDGLTRSAGATDDVKVAVTKLSGGKATGPAKQTWRIAQGSLKGIVYYNTYNSPRTNGGGVMRIKPGGSAEVLIDNCTVCHSVSAFGSRLAAGEQWSSSTSSTPPSNPITSSVFDLASNGSAQRRTTDRDGRKYSFGGFTPDGKLLLTNGVPPNGPLPRGLSGQLPSRLIDPATGAEVAAPSFTSAVTYALTPAFSPNATKVAFNWRDKSLGHSLAVMDVAAAQSPPVFSNLVTAVTSSRVAAWPSFTPDSKAIVFQEGDAFDTGGYGGGALYGDLQMVHLAAKRVVPLATLNGALSSTFYLPFGEAEDGHLNYEPTVLPVPVGGYFWVIFTSRRSYGNTVCNAASGVPGCEVAGGDTKFGTLVSGAEHPSPRKKLWVAAIDASFDGTFDPSHPAFYLPGQELEAGNMRAFAALEPCKQDGQGCASAAECCNGFCRPADDGADGGKTGFVCVPPPTGCSHEDEHCAVTADCCDAPSGYTCMNGRCARPAPPR